jgi:hypothetical protein
VDSGAPIALIANLDVCRHASATVATDRQIATQRAGRSSTRCCPSTAGAAATGAVAPRLHAEQRRSGHSRDSQQLVLRARLGARREDGGPRLSETVARAPRRSPGPVASSRLKAPCGLPPNRQRSRCRITPAQRMQERPSSQRAWLPDAWSGSPAVDAVVTALVLAVS